ncbi:hypothetical protein BKA58DRAFT_380930 [Alternaria rosae]|uniref:uncharacterized protein n=1 Tax=Alternaria rosae TaxID=1187941 RepID=UPI001E8DC9F0|nr:uncharacterized protein BKA58DRAFT_380930 [Alternaria rosae]KAH6876051.1 hypothetical protein BKA58DRAFT_380930 [Alternaria rosae]
MSEMQHMLISSSHFLYVSLPVLIAVLPQTPLNTLLAPPTPALQPSAPITLGFPVLKIMRQVSRTPTIAHPNPTQNR